MSMCNVQKSKTRIPEIKTQFCPGLIANGNAPIPGLSDNGSAAFQN